MKARLGDKYSLCLYPLIGLLFLIASGCQTAGTGDTVTTITPAIEVTPVAGQAVVIVDLAPLRSYPDTQAETVGNLSEGDLVDLLGVSPSEEWYLVKEVESAAGQGEAWVLAAFIEPIGTATPTLTQEKTTTLTATLLPPDTLTATTTLLPAPTATGTITASPAPTASEPEATFIQNGHCRQGPGTVYDIVTSLEAGVRVSISGRNADSSWWWIQLPNSQARCWVSAVVVAASGSPDDLPLGPIPPTPTLVPVNTPTPTDTAVPATEAPTDTLIPRLTPTATPPPEP